MDDPNCDAAALDKTYYHFGAVNRMLAGWGRIYRRWIRPRLVEGPATLVDIGCGGGDVPEYLAHKAEVEGLTLTVTGVDPDPRAIRYAKLRPRVNCLERTSTQLAQEGQSFDFVISNNLLHHLTADELDALVSDSEQMAGCAVIHNDILRDDLAYAGFSVIGAGFRGSFIRPDGLTSIRRSYTRPELGELLPRGWRAETLFPYRLLALHRK